MTTIAPRRAPARAKPSNTVALRRANVLLEVARRCAQTSSLDGILQVLVELTSRELDCDRGTLFLNDPSSGELFSRVAQGGLSREIRILNSTGIAGAVFQSGEALVIADAYADPRFNSSVDERTGYRTKSVICVPVCTMSDEVIGVMQSLNKRDEAGFTEEDLTLLQEMTRQAAVALQSLQYIEQIEQIRLKEMQFLELVSDINSEFDLSALLQRVVAETCKMLGSERATIFLHDPATGTLFSRVASGGEIAEIRLPSTAGIAGSVFTSAESMNIPYAYADLRFNPGFDRQTGFFTRSILCVPILNKENRVIGVTQVLNKKGGVFTDEDEQRLKAFTAQVAIALENSKLFDDVRRVKNYNDSMLSSMSNGVVTLDPALKIVTSNAAANRIWEGAPPLVGASLKDLLGEDSLWVIDKIASVQAAHASDLLPDAAVTLGGVAKSVNLTISPLVSEDSDKELGSMLMFEDISSEKRMKSTMSRYMDPVIAAQMLDGDGALDLLGGVSAEATIMFSDVRGFTTITEEYGAQGTVSFLNEYFSLMVDCITREGGMLDKFIGDAIMACFGLPVAHDDDPDRALRAGIAMIADLWTWNGQRRAKGLKTVDMGLGLNTDTVVSGNIGSPKRMDYTVIGDGVNLASRLESACKAYSARILASESTVKKLRGTYRTRDIDLVVVKGKTEPVRVFEVLDYHDAQSFPNLTDVVNQFNDGIVQYRATQWDKAIERFERCLALNPGDRLSQTYIDRCRILQASPPAGEWDGVWVMKEK
ncbi:adenylate/guanylate cyclase domain-containing protein [Sphingomonas sp. CROZ-RG-20F-R02-07]|uniref:adenylate/guanylate cyclase domain-containing protein n=1 Tax=Sphingomonas sp. CROZ-RG-20F-R02-07 TaxID=2914832 RepID=UPI001F577BA2|nr:adenylate/guanylate cyclase domain-containing protein [Sphingomonas sp. CROZ-RG-20F-R02-07]